MTTTYTPSVGSGIYRLPCGCLIGIGGTKFEGCKTHPEEE